MKVNIIFLDYHRHEFTDRARNQNLNNAGYPFDIITVNRKGISAAINEGITASKGYDAVVTMANDILMPENWLKAMVLTAAAIPNTGMCGIHCVEKQGSDEIINGVTVSISDAAFGNVLIPMPAINRVGLFNIGYDPYGMQDSDYAFRLKQTGHVNYYLHGLKSEHIGHDVGQPSDYRKMKDEGLLLCDKKWAFWTGKYIEENDYTINYPEWPL